jgi:hypothetical protein
VLRPVTAADVKAQRMQLGEPFRAHSHRRTQPMALETVGRWVVQLHNGRLAAVAGLEA